jgi:nitrate reductase assembly molybdenum cofactor insertion protein NarJ
VEEISVVIDALKTINPILASAVAVAVGLSWQILHWLLKYFKKQLEQEREFFKTQLAEDRKEFREALKEVCATFNKEVETCQAERAKMYEQVLKLVRRTADVATH